MRIPVLHPESRPAAARSQQQPPSPGPRPEAEAAQQAGEFDGVPEAAQVPAVQAARRPLATIADALEAQKTRGSL